MTQTIKGLRILPPFAIARLGSADEPMDNYTIELDAPGESGSTARLSRAQAPADADRRRTLRRNRRGANPAAASAIQGHGERQDPSGGAVPRSLRRRRNRQERGRACAADGRPPERERLERQGRVLDGQRRQSQGGAANRRRKRRGRDRQGGPATGEDNDLSRSRRGRRRRSRHPHPARVLHQLRVARQATASFSARCASSSPTRGIPKSACASPRRGASSTGPRRASTVGLPTGRRRSSDDAGRLRDPRRRQDRLRPGQRDLGRLSGRFGPSPEPRADNGRRPRR